MSSSKKLNIGVIGEGSFGTAMSLAISRSSHVGSVSIFSYTEGTVAEINSGENKTFLPGYKLNTSTTAYPSKELLQEGLPHGEIEYFIWGVPTPFTRTTAEVLAPALKGKHIISISKGIEQGTNLFVSEILREVIGDDTTYSVLSGPTFAKDIASNYHGMADVASLSDEDMLVWQRVLSSDTFGVRLTDDIRGVELVGAYKNTVALFMGLIDGSGFSPTTSGALFALGFQDMIRYAKYHECHGDAFSGFSGFGDLVMTSKSDQSRNRTVGLGIAAGATLDEILEGKSSIPEGVFTAKSIYQEIYGGVAEGKTPEILLPTIEATYKVVYGGKSIESVVEDLFRQNLRKK